MTARDDRGRFAPAGQLTMPGAPAQLGLDGGAYEPAPPPPLADCLAIIEGRVPVDQLSLALPTPAGELDVRRPRAQQRPKRNSARTRRKQRRRELVRNLRRKLKSRRQEKVQLRRSRMDRAITCILSHLNASALRVEATLSQIPPRHREHVRRHACGERFDQETGEVVPRVGLGHPRARKMVGLIAGLHLAAGPTKARPGWRLVVFPVARLAGIIGMCTNSLNSTKHRGDLAPADRWTHGDEGYLRSGARTGFYAMHQPRRPFDGRAPRDIPEDQRGPDDVVDGQTVPGYAFTQFWFPPDREPESVDALNVDDVEPEPDLVGPETVVHGVGPPG